MTFEGNFWRQWCSHLADQVRWQIKKEWLPVCHSPDITNMDRHHLLACQTQSGLVKMMSFLHFPVTKNLQGQGIVFPYTIDKKTSIISHSTPSIYNCQLSTEWLNPTFYGAENFSAFCFLETIGEQTILHYTVVGCTYTVLRYTKLSILCYTILVNYTNYTILWWTIQTIVYCGELYYTGELYNTVVSKHANTNGLEPERGEGGNIDTRNT